MPNWVYSGITISTPLTKKQEKILQKIEKTGSICDYYVPRDKEILETRSPVSIVSQKEYDEIQLKNKKKEKEHKEGEHLHLDRSITQKISDNLIKKYGTNNWYDWSNENWGTKWGDCDLEIDIKEGDIRFESAWSPISNKIMDMFIQDFPNIHYHFEEEQGWGAEYDFEDGEMTRSLDYDYPEWSDEDIEEVDGMNVVKLLNEHPRYPDGIGYYLDWGMEYVGETIEEAKEYLKNN
jgi:hypothetical protein